MCEDACLGSCSSIFIPWSLFSFSTLILQDYSKYTFPLAVAIVLSGQYEDDLDNSEDVIYTGQGGNNLLGDKKQMQDQKMERGNLALKVWILDSTCSVSLCEFSPWICGYMCECECDLINLCPCTLFMFFPPFFLAFSSGVGGLFAVGGASCIHLDSISHSLEQNSELSRSKCIQ